MKGLLALGAAVAAFKWGTPYVAPYVQHAMGYAPAWYYSTGIVVASVGGSVARCALDSMPKLNRKQRRATRLGRRASGFAVNALIVGAAAAPLYPMPDYGWVAFGTLAYFTLPWVKFGIGVTLRPARRFLRERAFGYGGSANFSGIIAEWPYWYRKGRYYLGRSLYDPRLRIGVKDDRHSFIIAPNATGKGVSAILPVLLTWPHSVFCIDPKGQNYAVAGARRGDGSGKVAHFMGQKVYVLDPYKGGDFYNPLAELDPKSPTYVEKLFSLVGCMVMDEGGKNGMFFNQSSMRIIGGLADFLIRAENLKPEQRTLVTLRDIIVSGQYPINAMKSIDGPAGGASAFITSTPKETWGNIQSSVLNHTAFLDSPGTRKLLAEHRFSMTELCDGDTSVFVCIPPHLLEENARLLRMLTNAALNAIFEGPNPKPRTLFMLDEAYVIGNLPILEKAMPTIRGYGAKVVSVYHNLSQLSQIYPKNFETFMANAGQIQILGTNDRQTAQYFSARLGKRISWRTDREGNLVPAGTSSLRDEEEIGRSIGRGMQTQIVLMHGEDPLILGTEPYYRSLPEGMFDDDPFEKNKRIRRTLWMQWQRLFGLRLSKWKMACGSRCASAKRSLLSRQAALRKRAQNG
ncbi:MAG: hypothetical protein BGO51_22030 [Rhodospirillales bacterium 69-11]|nr:type IV secretory system conjugative DNA transfer family protein [Rhodospirillales bacterium]OJW20523.1 MAG: hypothetical protein BGO51_22030 [Rhodospirillales bacterium 69-11]